MNVGELRTFLESYPDDMPVIFKYCSDYEVLTPEGIEVVSAVPQSGYVMRSHPTMSENNKARTQQMLCFPGN